NLMSFYQRFPHVAVFGIVLLSTYLFSYQRPCPPHYVPVYTFYATLMPQGRNICFCGQSDFPVRHRKRYMPLFPHHSPRHLVHRRFLPLHVRRLMFQRFLSASLQCSPTPYVHAAPYVLQNDFLKSRSLSVVLPLIIFSPYMASYSSLPRLKTAHLVGGSLIFNHLSFP